MITETLFLESVKDTLLLGMPKERTLHYFVADFPTVGYLSLSHVFMCLRYEENLMLISPNSYLTQQMVTVTFVYTHTHSCTMYIWTLSSESKYSGETIERKKSLAQLIIFFQSTLTTQQISHSSWEYLMAFIIVRFLLRDEIWNSLLQSNVFSTCENSLLWLLEVISLPHWLHKKSFNCCIKTDGAVLTTLCGLFQKWWVTHFDYYHHCLQLPN